MAQAGVSLLGLPRELRDQILGYLTHTRRVASQTDLEMPKGFSEPVYCRATIWIMNCPFLSVLLVNSQIQAEYLETECFKGLSSTIDSKVLLGRPVRCTPDVSPKSRAILARVRFVTLFVDYVMDPCSLSRVEKTLWSQVQPIVAAISSHTPGMSVLRLAVQQHDGFVGKTVSHRDLLTGSSSYRTYGNTRLLSPPPMLLAGLALAQRAEGYRYSYYSRKLVNSMFTLSAAEAADIIPGRNALVYYSIARAGMYLYGCDKIGKHYWTKEEVIDKWRLDDVAKYIEWCEPQSEDERKMLENLPYEMKEWKDKRGDEVVMWDAQDAESDVE